MSEHHYREEVKKCAVEEAIQSSQGKICKETTNEHTLGGTAGRVNVTQITDENSIVTVKIMICT